MIIEAIYRYYESTPISSYMFQFATSEGLKNAVVLELIKIKIGQVKSSCVN